MADILSLPWLQQTPDSFRSELKSVRSADRLDFPALYRLSKYGLDLTQLGRVGKAIDSFRSELAGTGKLRSAKLAIAASYTAEFLAEALPATGLRHSLLIDTFVSDYGQSAQSLLDPSSPLALSKPDFVLVALDINAVGLAQPILDEGEAEKAVQSALDYAISLRDAAINNVGAVAMLHTLVPPAETLFGNRDGWQKGSTNWLVRTFNARLAKQVSDDGTLLLDMAAIAGGIGLSRWHDPLRWHDAKIPYSLDAIPLLADHICRILAAARGLARKCLVLDLDNTLWAGVIGDDGVEGIKLGQGSAAGEAHLAVQKYALDLRHRGIVLAVCSKNEEAAALIPFREHDEMLLKEDHIAVFIANWTDKATNLKAIAKALNIGTDALVFLDDNPAERERVRQELPEVAVPEIGAEPAEYVPLLAGAGYFEAIAFSDEDRKRAEMYQANSQRAQAMQSIGNLEEYLTSLEMRCSIRPFDALGRARISQLTNKSNQFNLTTRRYTEDDIANFEADPAKFTMQVRLEDRFGDNGMISVIIFDAGEEDWLCDTWLMSCRVLGRRVEEASLAHVAAAAKQAGAKRLIGEYLPTAKNVIVVEHFAKLGFTLIEELEDGGTRWSLDLSQYQPPELPMSIEAEPQQKAEEAL